MRINNKKGFLGIPTSQDKLKRDLPVYRLLVDSLEILTSENDGLNALIIEYDELRYLEDKSDRRNLVQKYSQQLHSIINILRTFIKNINLTGSDPNNDVNKDSPIYKDLVQILRELSLGSFQIHINNGVADVKDIKRITDRLSVAISKINELQKKPLKDFQ